MRRRAILRAGLLAFGCSAVSPRVRADVSSWLFLGAGPSRLDDGRAASISPLTLEIATGLGTPPSNVVVLGGLLGTTTYFGEGTDVGLALRSATRGFVNGDWGASVDLGAYQRWWGVGSSGFSGSLVLGAPWGITLDANARFGTNDARAYSALLGVDLARLTVHRRTGASWWKNPFPAYRPEEAR